MENQIVFDKMGLQLGTQTSAVNGKSFPTKNLQGYALRKEQDFRENGLLVSTIFFSIMAIVFLIPVIEELVKPKFLFVVVVGLFLASVSIQDFIKIKNPGNIRIMLLTPYGARIGLQTTSNTVLREATQALEMLGVHEPDDAGTVLRMKATANGTSSVS